MEIKISKSKIIEKKIIEVSKNPKILIYFDGKKYYSFGGICPHAKWPLELGFMQEKILTCGGHGWEFDISEGKCVSNPGRDLKKFKIIDEKENLIIRDE